MRLVALDPAPHIAAVGVLTPRGEGAARLLDPLPMGVGQAGRVEVDLAEVTGEPVLRFRRMDRYESLGFAAAHLALRGAPVAPRGPADPEWGILIGSSLGCWGSNARFFLDLTRRAPARLSPALFAMTVSNAVNGEISIANRIGGANETFVSGWASGGEALVEAAAALAAGKARFLLAGGVEAPEAPLQRMHAARCREEGMEWLPPTIAEGAALCLLATAECDAAPGAVRLRACGRGHDPMEAWSPGEALRALAPLPVRTILVANTVSPRLLRRWRQETGDAQLISIPELTGEIGAAGAPAAVALAGLLPGAGTPRPSGALVIARAPEGGTIVLALEV